MNPDLPIEQRVDDIVSRLTLEEKISQMIHAATAIDRLGIPHYDWWSECLHGIARAGNATMFPQAIGLAATFDPDAMFRMATVISDEARAKYHYAIAQGRREPYHGLTFFTPNINIFRDPRWGRGQETYGEDPYLTGEMGLAFVKGMQGNDPKYLKTVATAKHYAVHSGPEYSRHTFDVHPQMHDLWDTYLPAFEKLIKKGNAYSVMCAYQRFAGSPCCGSDELLTDILRNQWGFKGYVVSDCWAIDNFHKTHKTSPDSAAAAATAVLAGTDLECGHGYWALVQAVKRGDIKESDLDVSVKRLFTARMKLGMFDPDDRVPYSKIPYSTVASKANQKQALEMARKSIVLLKNENKTLPLSKKTKTIAVIGPNADDRVTLLGNYKGSPAALITPLEGIRQKVGKNTKIIYDQATGLADDIVFLPVDLGNALQMDGKTGFKAEFFNNREHRGTPIWTQYDKKVDFFAANQHQTLAKFPPGVISSRWTSVLTPAKTGEVCFEVTNIDGSFRLFINDVEVLERGYQEIGVEHYYFQAKAGEKYNIRFEHSQGNEGASVSLATVSREKRNQDELLRKIAPADVIVFIGGLSPALEGEEMWVTVPGFKGGDRTSINLPAVQTELMKKLKATGKPVVFVMLTGSALAVTWEDENIPAIVNAWYGGQDAGMALADVLFGDYNPAGRLPVTFYASDEDLPPYEDYSMKNRTYRYFTGKPLYEFGYGLSFSEFEYTNLQAPLSIPTGGEAIVKATVRNKSSRDGEEVVQLYVSHSSSNLPLPLRSLQGVKRIFLKAGESKQVEFKLTSENLSVIDGLAQRCVIPGKAVISIGGRQPSEDTVAKGLVQQVVMELRGRKVMVEN
jgi:beta-glucosidase